MNIRKIILEVIDDLKWMDDISNDYVPRVGDNIMVINQGSEHAYLDWLGRYSHGYQLYGENIRGIVTNIIEDVYQFYIDDENYSEPIAFPIYYNGKMNDTIEKKHPNLKLRYISND